ncbi:hypothetical protein PMAYCL1PPCAC_22863, partial [Pristionchus mayeri]
VMLFAPEIASANRYADQLYEDLLYYYNKNVRPVKNATEAVKVKFGASLIRLIDVDEVNQVLTTNLWLEMQWFDYKLSWDPEKWNGIRKLHIPSDQIWIPDILLYNNADGEPHITTMSAALIYFTGLVVWKPPSIYKSFCPIDIEYFPYDSQECSMKFGGWSYNGFLLDVRQIPSENNSIITMYDEDHKEYHFLEQGMDLSSFYPSLEWDLLKLTSKRHEQLYPGCCGQEFYIDVTFDIKLRRKTLFYTVNLVIPCMLIAILTTFVYYIPPIEHKMSFSILILVSLSVFYLVLIDLIPPTSMVIPLIGKYLLLTMFLVSLSIIFSVITINFYRRDGSAQPMPSWVRWLFVHTLPRYILLKPVEENATPEDGSSVSEINFGSKRPSPVFFSRKAEEGSLSELVATTGIDPEILRQIANNIAFIADHFKAKKKEDQVSDDWTHVANVIDRLLLIFFSAVNISGTILIVVNSPVFFDKSEPLAVQFSDKPISGDTFENLLRTSNFTQDAWWDNSYLE